MGWSQDKQNKAYKDRNENAMNTMLYIDFRTM